MKLILSLPFLLIVQVFFAQSSLVDTIDFEGPLPEYYIVDTSSWEVGTPNFSNFTNAYNGPNVIASNLNGTPAGQQQFTVYILAGFGERTGLLNTFSFKYKMKAGSNTDANIYYKDYYADQWGEGTTDERILTSEHLNFDDVGPSDPIDFADQDTASWSKFTFYNYCLAVRPNSNARPSANDTLYHFRFTYYTDNPAQDEGWIIDDILIFDYPYCSGLDEVVEKKLNIYPNPASDKLEISELFNQGTIINGQGTRVKHFQSKSIDISSLQPGLYIVLLESNEGIFSSKVEIE